MPLASPRAGHPYHMHDAIYAQPGALRLLTRGQGATLEAAAAALGGAEHVWVTGVGSSWHVALVGELLLTRVGGLGRRVRALHAFDLVEYGPDVEGAAVVAITHRGANRYATAALSQGRSAGGVSVGVVHFGAAPTLIGTTSQQGTNGVGGSGGGGGNPAAGRGKDGVAVQVLQLP